MESTTPSGSPAAANESTVTDRRPVPRGVFPRGVQTWLLAGLALFMLAIMLVVGRPNAPARPASGPAAAAQTPSADRVRDYQERLKAAEERALAEAQTADQPPAAGPGFSEAAQPPPEDPIKADRRRREYESLFASNVVLSRRPDADRPDAGRGSPPAANSAAGEPAVPTMDEIADAAVRATARAGGSLAVPSAGPAAPALPRQGELSAAVGGQRQVPDRTGPIGATGPLHRLLEGTVIDAVLSNRLDGDAAAPVNCLVTNPIYSHSGQHVVIPAGARVLGETRPVQSLGETRLAVAFHRLLMPDGRTYRLDQFIGLNQIGDAGLRDKVNQHYLATFGAAAAVGLVSGLGQFLGSAGLGRGDGDRTVVIAGGVGDSTSQAALQVMNRFLNRLPTVTIREGHRVKVYLTSDLELPAYVAPTLSSRF
jgi:type IV secretion system protein TrbI